MSNRLDVSMHEDCKKYSVYRKNSNSDSAVEVVQ